MIFKHKHVIFGPTIVVISFVPIILDQHCFLRSRFSSQLDKAVDGVGEHLIEIVMLRRNRMRGSPNVSVNHLLKLKAHINI